MIPCGFSGQNQKQQITFGLKFELRVRAGCQQLDQVLSAASLPGSGRAGCGSPVLNGSLGPQKPAPGS